MFFFNKLKGNKLVWKIEIKDIIIQVYFKYYNLIKNAMFSKNESTF